MKTLNIISNSDDKRAQRLSNFSADPFMLDGEGFASVESFIQGTKFPPKHPFRQYAFQAIGLTAKRFGVHAERKFVWWKKQKIIYGSKEHHALIERALWAKFTQNPGAKKALLATGRMKLKHETGDPGPPNTSLPAVLFCEILCKIRRELLKNVAEF